MNSEQTAAALAAQAKGFDADLVARLAAQIAAQLPSHERSLLQMDSLFLDTGLLLRNLQADERAAKKLPANAQAEWQNACAAMTRAQTEVYLALLALRAYRFAQATGVHPDDRHLARPLSGAQA